MFGIGMPELLLILIVALIVIGPKKLPEMAKSMGRGYREFQRAISGVKDDINELEDNVRKDLNPVYDDKDKKDDPTPPA